MNEKINEPNWRSSIKIFLSVIAGLLSLTFLQAAFSHRALYADGSFFFLKAVVDGFFDDFQRQRLFVNLFNQLPLYVSTRLHIEPLETLSVIFGIPLFFTPLALVLGTAFIYFKKNFFGIALFPIAVFTFFGLPSLIFIINPAFTFLGIILLTTALFSLYKKPPVPIQIALLVLALLTFRSHESALFAAPILAAYCALQWRKTHIKFYFAESLIYILVTVYSIWWGMNAPVGQSYAAVLLEIIRRAPYYLMNTSLLYAVLGIAVFSINLLVHFYADRKNKLIPPLFYVIELAVVTVLCILHSWQLTRITTDPPAEFSLRILLLIGTIVTAASVFISRKFLDSVFKHRLVITMLFILVVFNGIWQINHTLRWQAFYQSSKSYTQQLKTHERADLSKIQHPEYRMYWTWPVFSMIQQNGNVRVLVLPEVPVPEESWLYIPKDPKEKLKTPFSEWENGSYLHFDSFHYQAP